MNKSINIQCRSLLNSNMCNSSVIYDQHLTATLVLSLGFRVKTEVKHASTPLKVNLRQQLQKQQLEDQLKQDTILQQNMSVAHSTAINMPITVQALKSELPQSIVQVSYFKLSLAAKSKIFGYASTSSTRVHLLQYYSYRS